MAYCFDTTQLEADEFDVAGFVTAHATAVTLEELRDELARFVGDLRAQLVEVINSDYNAFVKLSSKLEEFDEGIHKLRAPLIGVRDSVTAVRNNVAQSVTHGKQAAAAYQEAAARVRHLQRLAACIKDMEVAESLLVQYQGSKVDSTALDCTSPEFEDQCAMLDRAAFRVGRVMQVADAHVTEAFFQALQPKIHQLERGIVSELAVVLRLLLSQPSETAEACVGSLDHILRAYCEVSKSVAAEQVYLHTVVTPFIDNAFTKSHVDGAVRGSFSGLRQVFDQTIALVESQTWVLSTADSITDLNLLTNALVHAVVMHCTEHFPTMFSAAIADTYRTCFVAWREFVQKLTQIGQAVCPFAAAALQGHAAIAVLEHKLQVGLPVYFQLVSTSITAPVAVAYEAKLPDLSEELPGGDEFVMPACNAVWQACQALWTPPAFLLPLAPSSLKLSLQLLNQLNVWAAEGTKPDKDSSGQWVGVSPTLLLVLSSDLALLQHKLVGSWLPLIQSAVVADAAVASSLAHAVNAIVDKLGTTRAGLGAGIMTRLSAKCVQGLAPGRQLVAMYRMTNKAAPTEALPYATVVLQPLVTFIKQYRDRIGDLERPLTAAVVNDVVAAFQTQASNILRNLKNMDQSMQWLSAGDGGAAGLSDSQKISLQLQYDIKALGKTLDNVGVASAMHTGYQELSALVRSSGR